MMAQEVRCVELKRSESHGFGFSILGGSGSELPPIVYDIVDNSPASACGQLEAGDVILEVNSRQVADLTTKEVLKCLRLSQRSVSLKLQRDDVIKERVRQYLESSNTLASLRSAITQQDLTHVRDVLAMKSPPQRRLPASPAAVTSVPCVPLMHSPPKGRPVRPLPPPGAPPLPPPSSPPAADTNGHGHDRPRFETFTMTGDMMLNLSRTPAGETPLPPPPPRLPLARSPDGGSALASGRGGDEAPPPPSFRGSRSEERLLTSPVGEPPQETAGSLDPLLDTTSDEPIAAAGRLCEDDRSAAAAADGRVLWTGSEPAAVRVNGDSERDVNGDSEARVGDSEARVGDTGDSGGDRLTGDSGGSLTVGDSGGIPVRGDGVTGGGLSPDSEDGSDSESLQSFHFSQKAVDVPSAVRLAKRLFQLDGFRKSDVSRHLSKNNGFSRTVADEYVKYFDFSDSTLDAALSQFLERFALTGETQERERVLVHFSRRYMDNNPRAFNSPDACHTLTCALMLLNTDLHVQHVPRKMTCAEFVDNLSELNDGEDFPVETLRRLYQAIRARPLNYATDDEYEEMQAVPATDLPPVGGGSNPFLAAPDPSRATEYKRGYMMRKCCVDPNGKRTALGRRSWLMFHCTLRDLVLYLHKDENGSRRPAAFDHLHNAIRVHHALASKAEDYFKKQHVFKLQTADQAEYLLQTSDAKELQSWVDTINFVAASLSSPPLPGAVGSQRRFQRPLLPAGVTPLSLHDQLQGHEQRLTEIETELADIETAEPSKASQQQRHYQRHKAAFLQSEVVRYRTYSQLLRSKMAAQVPAAESPPPPADGQATPADDAAVAVSPASDRGRAARPTDRVEEEEEEGQTDSSTAASDVTATKEELLKNKKHRPGQNSPPLAGAGASGQEAEAGSLPPPATAATDDPAAAADDVSAADAAAVDDTAADAADVSSKKKRRWWQK